VRSPELEHSVRNSQTTRITHAILGLLAGEGFFVVYKIGSFSRMPDEGHFQPDVAPSTQIAPERPNPLAPSVAAAA